MLLKDMKKKIWLTSEIFYSATYQYLLAFKWALFSYQITPLHIFAY